MNSQEEIVQTIAIGLVVATFLLNTGRALKAIALCKESLVLLNNKALSIEKQFGKLFYERIYFTMFEAYCRIRDSTNAITYGRKLLDMFRERGETVQEGKLTMALAKIYWSQNKYDEARELNKRAVTIMRETGDKQDEAIASGNLGTMFRSLGEYVKAKEYLEKALVINKEISDRAGEAANYGNLGTVFHSLGEYVKAKEYLEKALAIIKEIGDRAGEAAGYGNIGNVFHTLGEYVKAKEYLEKALAIIKEIGDRAEEAAGYGNVGNVFHSLGEFVEAKEYHEKALAINKEIGDRAREGAGYENLGTVFHSLGEHAQAKECYEKALTFSVKIGDRSGEATLYGNLGTVSHSLGEYVKAKEYLEKALAINKEIGDRAGEAANYGNLGTLFQSLSEYVKAKECHKKALEINKEIGDRAREAANYGNLGTLFQSLSEYVKAKECHEKALEINKEIGDRAREAANYGNLGTVFHSLGEYVMAKKYHERALAINKEIGDRQIEAKSYRSLGTVLPSLGDHVMAEQYLEKALTISKDVMDSETEIECFFSLALTKLSQEKFQEAFSYLFQSIEKCEDLRGSLGDSDQIKISFADMHVLPYMLLSAFFCAVGNPNNALSVIELGRARALADLMATQYSAETHLSANPQSWNGIENAMKKESNCTCLYISYHAQEVYLWILKTRGVISFRKIKVDKNTLRASLAMVAENLDGTFANMAKNFRSFGMLPEEVCEDQSFHGSVRKPDSSQEESLAALRQEKGGDGPKTSLTLFYKMLIDPVSDLLEGPEIIIVPDRSFYRVPFPALLDESGKCLSETFRIRIVSSLTTLKLIQDSPADYHIQTGALIVGDPDVGEVLYEGSLNRNFVPLPGARKEAEIIGRLLGVQPLLGQHATKQAVLQKINSVSLIHLAARGNAERGEIALAPLETTTGIPQEDHYLLKMSDISQIQLRAKLVVLSCSYSGRGQIGSEGVVGIARAFLGSGARSVLVAMRALEDSATEQMMSRFYEHLVRGESASESLHEAMKWMRENGYTKVSEWAPFLLIGDNVAFAFGNKVKEEKTLSMEKASKKESK
ncbi:uncharacterized protein LOC144640748 [Oculina patagonica]